MISSNYQISFKSANLLDKTQEKTSQVNKQPTITNVLTVKSPEENRQEISSNKLSLFAKVSGFLGMLAGGLAAFTGVKALINKPSAANKQLMELLENRLTDTNSLIKTMREFCEDTYGIFAKTLRILKPAQTLQPDITKYQTELDTARNFNEVLTAENKYLEDLRNWMVTTLDKNNAPETYSEIFKLRTQLGTKISELKQSILEKIQTNANLDDIPEKLTKGKNAKKIIAAFQETLNEKIELLNDAHNQTEILAELDLRGFQADIQKASAQIVADEKISSLNFLNEVKRKIAALTGTNISHEIPLDTKALQALNFSDNILANQIFQFIQKSDKSPEDYIHFIGNMSETMNLKDIKILSERLQIREMTGIEQFQNTTHKADELYELCNNLLLKMFKDSGKNIDLNNININDIETNSLKLSKAFGYKSIGEMITDLLVKYNHRPEISESTLSKLYKRYNDRFLENSTSDLITIKRGNDNLFNWSPLE